MADITGSIPDPIVSLFTNFMDLDFIPHASHWFYPWFPSADPSSTIFSSASLVRLHVDVEMLDDFLYLLDGHVDYIDRTKKFSSQRHVFTRSSSEPFTSEIHRKKRSTNDKISMVLSLGADESRLENIRRREQTEKVRRCLIGRRTGHSQHADHRQYGRTLNSLLSAGLRSLFPIRETTSISNRTRISIDISLFSANEIESNMTVVLSIVGLFSCIILIATVGKATGEISTLRVIDRSIRILFRFSRFFESTSFLFQCIVESQCHHFCQPIHRWFQPIRPLRHDEERHRHASNSVSNILIWQNNSTSNPTKSIQIGSFTHVSVFVTSDEHIFVGSLGSVGQIERWTLNRTQLSSAVFPGSYCLGLFVDVDNHLYCSSYYGNQVLRQSLTNSSSVWTIVAGNGFRGSTGEMLNIPQGIFVTIDLDLYVADSSNHRVQLFRSEQGNGTTVAGRWSTGTIELSLPVGVVVDADGYLFIVDLGNHRILGSDRIGMVFDVLPDVRAWMTQNPVNWIGHNRWVSTWMETSLSQIRRMIEFKSSSWPAILVLRRKCERERRTSRSSFSVVGTSFEMDEKRCSSEC